MKEIRFNLRHYDKEAENLSIPIGRFREAQSAYVLNRSLLAYERLTFHRKSAADLQSVRVDTLKVRLVPDLLTEEFFGSMICVILLSVHFVAPLKPFAPFFDQIQNETPKPSQRAMEGLVLLAVLFFQGCVLDGSSRGLSLKAILNLVSLPPVLLSTIPLAGATNADPVQSVAITFTFDKAMDTNRLPTGNLNIYDGASYVGIPNNLYNTSVAWKTSTDLTITLGGELPEGSGIQTSLTGSTLFDTSGNSVQSDLTLSFSTGWKGAAPALSDTSQTGCWDNSGNSISCSSTGMDGELLNFPSAKNLSAPQTNSPFLNDPISKDNLTGLIWKSCLIGQVWSGTNCQGTGTAGSNWGATSDIWMNSLLACYSLNSLNTNQGYAGRRTWRLPTIREIQSILEYQQGTFIPTNFIPGHVSLGVYWSATTAATFPAMGFIVNTGSGYTLQNNKTSTGFSICVTNGP
ncbi:hypothetical protein CH373_04915 [Leptospira perolatii]|uniref:Uncharacterized protein n=1 Tax=Leptospira perolatii TaxID=2023191 RepID=A0A2M9ZQD3_9LEPT|nr:DUF1566 domain-containing protein [Leptospira perolatii]PJZ70418.1 hypothetical protein CH360_05335 [Leptospira perolatii]PJZ74254.1 hypothetical protein CH373_04915 [Leptospira perolatii]